MKKTVEARIVEETYTLLRVCNDISNADLAGLSPGLRDSVIRLRLLVETKGHT